MAEISTTSAAALTIIKETDFGVTPATGAWQKLRFTSESLNINQTTVKSEELRADRQIQDLIATKVEAVGDINGELSYSTYDRFIQAVLGNSDPWPTSPTKVIKAGATINSSGAIAYTELKTAAQTLKAGQAIGVRGYGNVKNNRIVVIEKISTASASSTQRAVTLIVKPVLIAESNTRTISLAGMSVDNGTVQEHLPSFSIEKAFTDTSKFIKYTGMTVGTMSLNVSAEDKIGISFSFLGKNGETKDTKFTTGSPVAQTKTEIQTSILKNSFVFADGKQIATIKSITLEINGNLRGLTAIGTAGNVETGYGRMEVTGNLEIYFKNFDLYKKYLSNTSSSLTFSVGSPANDIYVFNMPTIKFTEASIPIGGADQAVMITCGYQALLNDETGKTITVTKMDGYTTGTTT